MKKVKRGGNPAKANIPSNHDNKPIPSVSYDVSNVLPELWATIATFASRQTLARLSAASREFYYKLSPLLYGNIFEPPLTAVQSSALIETLGKARTPSGRPHLAEQVQHLKLTPIGTGRTPEAIKAQNKTASDVLRNMYRLIPGAESRSGSVLRVLHWNLTAGLDELGTILGAPGHFPNLKELFVSTTGTNNNFNFIQIRGLEVLGITFSLWLYDECYENGNKLCYKLAEAMQMLPSSSPLLHTLRLSLNISFTEDEFPYQGFHDLVDTINLVHLPVLATLDISVETDPDDFDVPHDILPSADFSSFMASHPTLLRLALRGTQPLKKPSSFPCLRSFDGSFKDSATICNGNPPLLETLAITFLHSRWSDDIFPSFQVVPLVNHMRLTKLQIAAMTSGSGSAVKLTNELSPASFVSLVGSFPNLTDLDICISKPMTKYRETLLLLTKLRSLRFQEYRTYLCTCPHFECIEGGKCYGPKKPIKKVFPPQDYTAELLLLLPTLRHLASMDINILGDHMFPIPECNEDMIFEDVAIEVDYRFSVVRKPGTSSQVILNTRVSRDRRHCFC
ncbi:hypothetical protein B0H14DRAFT_3067516 [Mycena olivaceomarginata]|nr:hypothetical protein B0H14DRAFT_3067516 [Mycena olivaceomarginata]